MRSFILALGSLAVLTACATPTPYQSATGNRWGYEETQIESNRSRISFGGNSMTDRETVETYLLYRSAELTLERGFDYFTLVERYTDEETRVVGHYQDAFAHPGFSVHYAYFHPRWGWRGWHDPFWDDVTYREISRYEASAEIIMNRGRKPQHDPGAFDARDVVTNLGHQIVRPEPG